MNSAVRLDFSKREIFPAAIRLTHGLRPERVFTDDAPLAISVEDSKRTKKSPSRENRVEPTNERDASPIRKFLVLRIARFGVPFGPVHSGWTIENF